SPSVTGVVCPDHARGLLSPRYSTSFTHHSTGVKAKWMIHSLTDQTLDMIRNRLQDYEREWVRKDKGTSLSITAATWRRCFSAEGSRSMRAISAPWTVSGTTDGRLEPCSTTVQASSSRKKGFPFACSRSRCTRDSGTSTVEKTSCTRRRLSRNVRGCTVSWVE